jgi:hypothetical protein
MTDLIGRVHIPCVCFMRLVHSPEAIPAFPPTDVDGEAARHDKRATVLPEAALTGVWHMQSSV